MVISIGMIYIKRKIVKIHKNCFTVKKNIHKYF